MTSTLVQFWRQLRRFVHPRDQSFLRTNEHPFHLNFPPPAYNGDIDRAPVILLTANGGWIDDAAVKQEMRLFGGQKKYLDYIHNPRPMQLNEMNVWVLDKSPVKFTRTVGMRPLSTPQRGGLASD